MEKSLRNKYYKILKDYYVNRRVKENTCERYDDWMTHKYRHTMMVTKAGREIIENDDNLKNLSQEIKDEFIYACLFHDIGRAIQMDAKTGELISDYHGIDGALVAQQHGVNSLNILIPVMLHDLINGALLYLPMYELEVDVRYTDQPQENRVFIREMRERFSKLSEEKKETVELGRRLVKDADMLANWREFERMTYDTYSKEIKINDKVKEDLFKAHLVDKDNLETVADYICLLIAWGTSIYYPYSIKSAINDDIIGRLRKFLISSYEKDGKSKKDIAPILNIVDEGIDIVRNKMDYNIANH